MGSVVSVCVSHRLRPLDGGDADETGESSRLKQVADVLTGPEQTGSITTWRQTDGRQSH